MPLMNAFSKAVVRDFSIEELKQAARLMRGYDLVALCAAGSGHSGGTLSMMEIVAALYLKVANHDPNVPEWADRDRIVWSGGHKAPALYLGLGMAGYYPLEDVVTLRKLYSPFQGHPHRLKLPGVEVSSGSLGQGLSIAVGMALAGKMAGKNAQRVLHHGRRRAAGRQHLGSGDGRLAPQARQPGGHHRPQPPADRRLGERRDERGAAGRALSRVRLGSDRVDGHDIQQVVDALQKAKNVPTAGKPTVIIANTVKGKGVSFMENQAGWHGKTPNYEELVKALDELGLKQTIAYDALLKKAAEYQKEVDAKLDAKMPHFSQDYWWNNESRSRR